MKYWLSRLPSEVWVDVFRLPGKSRQQLGQMVDRIGNYKFGEYLQFYLHDWGKRTLKMVRIEKYVYVSDSPWKVSMYMEIPRDPLPANIRSFECIQINLFDARTLAFLHRIRRLLTDVKLDLSTIQSGLHTILPSLVPLLANGTIHSLGCNVRALPTVRQHLRYQQLANLKVLTMWQDGGMDEAMQQENVNFVTNWLTSPTSSVGPKLFECEFHGPCLEFSEQLFKAIREQFLAAKTPCTFVIVFCNTNWGRWEFADFQLENGIGEEMHGVLAPGVTKEFFQITRHPASCGPQLQEWIKENMDKKKPKVQQIQFWYPTIGTRDADTMDQDGLDEDGAGFVNLFSLENEEMSKS